MKSLKYTLVIVGLLSFAGCEYKADITDTSSVKTTKDMKCGAGKCGKDMKCGTGKCK